jgi:L-histidine N-alpha-methyltransferase
MGVDLKKDPAVLHAAYNDSQGVTAEFNRNILKVLNRELGSDFDVGEFEHQAVYRPEAGRVEMLLIARTPQRVTIPGWKTVEFAAGESIRTEISTKYDRDGVADLFGAAGLMLEHWESDARGWYALAIGRCVQPAR